MEGRCMKDMKKAISSVLCLLLALVVFSGTTAAASVAPTTTNLPGGILIGDQEGIHADKHGYYYIDARNLHPGDVIHKVVTVQNLEGNDLTPEGKIPYTMSMTSEPLFSLGPVDLLDATHLTIKLDGKIIYDGTCRGNGTPNMLETALPLGVYALGDRHSLDFTLTVDPNMKLSKEKSEADFRWHFYAWRKADYTPPPTGEELMMKYMPAAILGGMLLVSLLLLGKKRKRQEKDSALAER
jgi:hypothetical protein